MIEQKIWNVVVHSLVDVFKMIDWRLKDKIKDLKLGLTSLI